MGLTDWLKSSFTELQDFPQNVFIKIIALNKICRPVPRYLLLDISADRIAREPSDERIRSFPSRLNSTTGFHADISLER